MAQLDEFDREVININLRVPFLDKWLEQRKERMNSSAEGLSNPTSNSLGQEHTEAKSLEKSVNLASLGKIELPTGAEFEVDNNTQPNQPTVNNGSAASVSSEKAQIF